MKAKIVRGKSFRGLLRYVLDEKPRSGKQTKKSEILSGNLIGSNSKQLTQEFNAVRFLRPDIDKPVWHCSLSASKGEKLSSEQWDTIVRYHLKRMGIDADKHPFVAVRHSDTGLDHVHIVASRISDTSEVWQGEWDVFKAIQSTQDIEQNFGLTRTKGLERKGKKSLTGNEINKANRKVAEPPRTYIQRVIDEILKNNPTGTQFLELLDYAEIKVKANVSSTGVNGLSFTYNGLSFSGSKLGNDYKWNSLLQRGLMYEQDREFETFRGYGATGESKTIPENTISSERSKQSNRGTERQSERVDERTRQDAGEHKAGTRNNTSGTQDIIKKQQDSNRENFHTRETSSLPVDSNRESVSLRVICAFGVAAKIGCRSHPGYVDPALAITRISKKTDTISQPAKPVFVPRTMQEWFDSVLERHPEPQPPSEPAYAPPAYPVPAQPPTPSPAPPWGWQPGDRPPGW